MSDNAYQLSLNRSPASPAGTGSMDPVLDRAFANPLANASSRRGAEGTIPASVASEEFHDEGTLVVEQHFAIVPEWIIDADISDSAYRLYSVLLRYGQSSGQRMPGRALLAKRLKKRSTDTVDRALKELVAIGAVAVERRRHSRQNLTNRYCPASAFLARP